MNINTNFFKLKDSYLFSTIARKIASYSKANPKRKSFVGIGDVTLPLCKAVIDEMQAAVCEMGNRTFRGYGRNRAMIFGTKNLKYMRGSALGCARRSVYKRRRKKYRQYT